METDKENKKIFIKKTDTNTNNLNNKNNTNNTNNINNEHELNILSTTRNTNINIL